MEVTGTICACVHWHDEHDLYGGCCATGCSCSQFIFSPDLNTPTAIAERGGEHGAGQCQCALCKSNKRLSDTEMFLVLRITTAYEQGMGKGLYGHKFKAYDPDIANPYTEGTHEHEGWRVGHREGCDKRPLVRTILSVQKRQVHRERSTCKSNKRHKETTNDSNQA